MGVFDPQHAAAAGILLEGMDFSGVGRVREQVAALARRTSCAGEVCRDEIPDEGTEPLARAVKGASQLAQRAAEEVKA